MAIKKLFSGYHDILLGKNLTKMLVHLISILLAANKSFLLNVKAIINAKPFLFNY